MRSAEQAAAYAIERANSGEEMAASGYCLQFVRECYPMAAYYYSAIDAWNAAEIKHPGGSPTDAPPGFPCFFYSSSPYDHVVISVGDGKFASVWNEEIRILSASTVLGTFGPFIGYSEDLNRVRIYSDTDAATGEDDDMRMIRRGSNGTTALIGDGWYLPLGDSSISAFTNLGLTRTALEESDFDTILACLVQGTTAIWAATVDRGTALVPALQELADAKTNAVAANEGIAEIPGGVWAVGIKRGGALVPALQELADAKTYAMQSDATLDGIVAAFRHIPGVDGDAVVADIERRRAAVVPARAQVDGEEIAAEREWPTEDEAELG